LSASRAEPFALGECPRQPPRLPRAPRAAWRYLSLCAALALCLLSASCRGPSPSASPDPAPSAQTQLRQGQPGQGQPSQPPASLNAALGAPLPDDLSVLAASLRADVSALADPSLRGRDDSTPGGVAARAYIADRLRACGIQPLLPSGYSQPIDGLPDAANILGLIPGADPALRDRYLVVSAHHDHVGPCTSKGDLCLGADDNAAAVATVLHVGCALAATPAARRRSILIATWDAEEPPTFLTPQMGSQFFTDHPPIALGAIDLAFVLDLVGSSLWPGFPGHMILGAEHSAALSALVDAATSDLADPSTLRVARVGLHLIEHTPYGHHAWSDYDALRAARVPFLFLSNGQNKRYHTPADLPDVLDFPKMAAQTHLLLDLIERADSLQKTPDLDLDRQDLPHDAASVLALIDAALDPAAGLLPTLHLSIATHLRLSADRRAVSAITTSPNPPSPADIQTLRTATQRIMCLCGPYAPEIACLAL
jgi:hypothetical protein